MKKNIIVDFIKDLKTSNIVYFYLVKSRNKE